MMLSSAILALAAASAVSAQCRQNLLVDDFSTYQRAIVDDADRQVNKLGGDYGAVNATFETDTNTRTTTVTPVNGGAFNYWFIKYDAPACFDLRGYTHLIFTMRAPAGSTFQITNTQKAPNCVDRLDDSVYIPVTRYTTPNGQFQEVRVPMADFALNVNGTAFDYQHLKDLTFVDFAPANGNTHFEFQNMYLQGNCTAPSPLPSAAPSPPPASPAASPAASPSAAAPSAVTSPQASSGNTYTASLVSSIFAAVASIFVL